MLTAQKETYRIRSECGVTQAPYATRKAAQSAADRANREAPEQRWIVLPESYFQTKETA